MGPYHETVKGSAFLCGIIQTEQVAEPATLTYVEQLVCSPWPDELFVLVGVLVGPYETAPSSPFLEPGPIR